MAHIGIVGGGPAGLATAIAARQAGLDVTLVDRAHAPIDKACGEGLMPAGVSLLESLGVSLAPERCHPFHGIRYIDALTGPVQQIAEGDFPTGSGLGIRRTELQSALLTRAEALGATLCWGEEIEGISQAGLCTSTREIPVDWIVGADGLHSPVRKWSGIETTPGTHTRFGIRQHFQQTPWSAHVEVYWGPGVEAYVTPVSAQEVGIALLWNGSKARFPDLLAKVPALQERVAQARSCSQPRGAGPLHQKVEQVWKDRTLLIGDASGYLDAITGEGMAMSFRQAQALATCLKAGRPQDYPRAHRAICRPYYRLTHLVLWAGRHPELMRRAIRGLSRDPGLFSRVLGLVEGQKSIGQLGWTSLLRFVVGLAFRTGKP